MLKQHTQAGCAFVSSFSCNVKTAMQTSSDVADLLCWSRKDLLSGSAAADMLPFTSSTGGHTF